jgi:lipopolysaccharide export system protein LptC
MTAAGIELNLPDLPEVPIQLGPVPGGRPPPPREVLPWSLRLRLRLRDTLTSYLPLLLMLVLALGTWWLVKNSPGPMAPREASAARSDPDYTMTGFSVQRFAADGRLKVRLDGQRMRHFPATDRIEIDAVTIRAFAPDGRITVATAQRALANGDATEVQLLGGASVRSVTLDGAPVEIDSEFLHAFFDTERLTSHLPVKVRVGANEMRAGGISFDNLARLLELKGPMRVVFAPVGGKQP